MNKIVIICGILILVSSPMYLYRSCTRLVEENELIWSMLNNIIISGLCWPNIEKIIIKLVLLFLWIGWILSFIKYYKNKKNS